MASKDPNKDPLERAIEIAGAIVLGLAILAMLWLMSGCSALDPYGALYAQPATGTPSQVTAPTARAATPTPRPVYTVASEALEIRTGPSEARPNTGTLARDRRVYVFATAQAEQEYCTTWAAIDASLTRWVCFQFLTTGE